jgi:hypothetical protein
VETQFSVQTPKGHITVGENSDPHKPGIWVAFNQRDIARVEYDTDMETNIVRVWAPDRSTLDEDPGFRIDLSSEELFLDQHTSVDVTQPTADLPVANWPAAEKAYDTAVKGVYGEGLLVPTGEVSDKRKALVKASNDQLDEYYKAGDAKIPDVVRMDAINTLTPMHRFFMEFIQRNYVKNGTTVTNEDAYAIAKGMEDYFVSTYMPTIADDNDLVQG